jgi:hypothetical protein
LHSFVFESGSAAHEVFAFDLDCNVDPFVNASMLGMAGVVPPPASWVPIQLEAVSIVTAYAALTANAFVPGAPLPAVPLLLAFPANQPAFSHAQIAAHKILERIQAPGAGFPAINGVGAGTFLCSLTLTFSNAIVQVNLLEESPLMGACFHCLFCSREEI